MNQAMWVIRGGRSGELDTLFLKQNRIALLWDAMGDLGSLSANREAFKNKMMEVMPNQKTGYYPAASGQLYRFLHEMSVDDLVLYPSKVDRQVHMGKIIGPYEFLQRNAEGCPHQRSVKWLSSFPRTLFSQGALFEIGSALSFFQVRNYTDEFIAALEGKVVEKEVDTDESIPYVAEEIQQNTQDFILKTFAQELKGHAFAEFFAHLLNTMGYRTRVAPPGPDGGVDILAHKDELGFEPPIIKVQVKSTEGNIGDPVVSQLIGKLEPGEFGMLVTLGGFTSQALNTAKNKSNLRLVDGDELIRLILQHYEQFDSKYKGLIPLKRVYVPEALKEGD